MGRGRQESTENAPDDRIVNALDFGGGQVTAGCLQAAGGSGARSGLERGQRSRIQPVQLPILLNQRVGEDHV